jgi:hypothetical protein
VTIRIANREGVALMDADQALLDTSFTGSGALIGRRARFGAAAPPLPPQRAAIVNGVHTVLTILAVAYLLRANYVIFTGGNAPLTHWQLSEGSNRLGTFMFFLGNWVVLLLFQVSVNGPLHYLLCGLLQPPREPGDTFSSAPLVAPPAASALAQWDASAGPLAELFRGPSGMPTFLLPEQGSTSRADPPEWRKN